MDEPAPTRLRELVRRHRVCWDVWPLHSYTAGGERIQVGFELDIQGTYDHPEHPPTPGCPECEAVFRALHDIAEWILPDPQKETELSILTFDRGIRRSSKRDFRDEVQLQILIRHRVGYRTPVDACEVRCLETMERRLAALGAHKGRWRTGGG